MKQQVNAWGPATHGRDLDGIPGSWGQPVSDLGIMVTWDVSQQVEDLCHYAFQVNIKSLKLKKIYKIVNKY